MEAFQEFQFKNIKHLKCQTTAAQNRKIFLGNGRSPLELGKTLPQARRTFPLGHKNQQYCVCWCCLPRWFWMNPAYSDPWLWAVLFHSVMVLMMNAGCLSLLAPAVPETRLGNHFQVRLWTVWLLNASSRDKSS